MFSVTTANTKTKMNTNINSAHKIKSLGQDTKLWQGSGASTGFRYIHWQIKQITHFVLYYTNLNLNITVLVKSRLPSHHL